MMAMRSQETFYGAVDSVGSPSMSSFATTYSSTTKENPTFTYSQVGLICERMLKEHESQIGEEMTVS
jgi:hypothetical protein